MPVNDFKPFAIGTTPNVPSQPDYEAFLAAQANKGFNSGVARSNYFNKVFRQATVIAAALAQVVVNASGVDLLDNANFNQTVDKIEAGIRAVAAAEQVAVSIANFPGYDPTGATDSSAAVNAAFSVSPYIYIPPGTHSFAVTRNDDCIIFGAGSKKAYVKPYLPPGYNPATDAPVAAITYTNQSSAWTYSSQIRNLCFLGTSKVGIGVTLARADPTGFVNGDQYANNLQFYNCLFRALNKGVQFPSGNIGSSFWCCGFQSNKYGAYLLDNKWTGDIMHAGNKYWYSGEFSDNDCAVYCSNITQGFGGVAFKDTIFEFNKIALYTNISGLQFIPFQFDGVWFEGNGQTMGASAETVVLDLWTGNVRTTQTVLKRTFIFDGTIGRYNFIGGNFTDANVGAAEATVLCVGSNVEKSSGFTGGSIDVNLGQVELRDCNSAGGFPLGFGVICTGNPQTTAAPVDGSGSIASRRAFQTAMRSAINPKLLQNGVAEPLIAARTATGSLSVAGSVVNDGRLFTQCNEFSASYNPGQYTGLSSTSLTTIAAGWHVMTVDVKVLAGAPNFYLWDRSASQVAVGVPTARIGVWNTIAVLAYVSAAGRTFFFDWGNPAATGTCTVRVSAFQCHRFDTRSEALQFLDKGAYSYDAAAPGWTPDTGTSKRTANATYSATASAGYVQAELQAAMNALRDATQTIKALKEDLVARSIIGS